MEEKAVCVDTDLEVRRGGRGGKITISLTGSFLTPFPFRPADPRKAIYKRFTEDWQWGLRLRHYAEQRAIATIAASVSSSEEGAVGVPEEP